MSDTNIPGPTDEQLRLQSLVTKTASYNGAPIEIEPAGFAPGGAGGAGQPMKVYFRVSALDLSDLDETYSLKLQDSPDDFTFTDRSEARAITATGVGAIGCSIVNRYVRLVLTAGGTTPSITYEAWLTPYVLGA